jgi:peptidyl-prolyl cis-trans isomerase D
LKQLRGGADFAELAKKNSEDTGSAVNGGDLDYFGRGRMVAEFDQVAFTLEPGQLSDPVKSQFGYHIIKVVDKKPATVRTLQEVRQQLQDQLAYETAQTQAGTLADTIQRQVSQPGDLDSAAQAHGLTVQESAFFARDEPIPGVGPSPEAAARAFEMNQGEVSGPLNAARGIIFETVTGIQPPAMPKLDEVKDRVRDAVLRQKALDISKQRAMELAAKVKGAADFERAAKAAGVEVKTTELITRDAPVPDLGIAPEVMDAAFALPVGGVSAPITTEGGTALIKVVEKQEVSPTEWAANRDRFRGELLGDRRNRFFGAYMLKAKARMRIEVFREALQRTLS